MNRTNCMKHAKRLALGLAVLAIAATPSFAQMTSYDLCATAGTVTMPDAAATVVPIWGFVAGDCTGVVPTAELPGLELRAAAGDALTINLHNNLTVPVSFFMPGYRAATTGGTAGLFTAEAAPGGSATYDFTARAGTFLYHSGTDITTQVPMGLYGALVVDFGPGQAYDDVTYGEDEVLVYSEIDPNLNNAGLPYDYCSVSLGSCDPDAPACPGGVDDVCTHFDYGGARVTTWNPQYFLINGKAHPVTSDIPIGTNADVLLRFVNAGLRTFVPTLDGGLYMNLVAEDGNRYPQPLRQYGIELQAGKTIDAMVSAAADGSYALYDRAASYDSGVTVILAGAVGGAPTAVDDPNVVTPSDYTIAEDGLLTTVAGGTPAGVLDNDLGAADVAILVGAPSAGTLNGGLAADGSFTYQPNLNFNGTDTFTYKANDGIGGANSNVATVTITVTPENDAPVAVGNAYNAIEGETLIVAAPGVLSNDSDPDGDALTAVFNEYLGAGALALSSDGSFTYAPAGAAGTSDSFKYHANDGALDSNIVTVYLTIVPPAANVAPFANDDFAEVDKNSGVADPANTFSLTANDVDPDGTIVPATVDIITGGFTQRGGTVTDNNNGTVTYVPKRGFRGTDAFQYQVDDNEGATSNVATVRVNVL